MAIGTTRVDGFTDFFHEAEPRLRRALVASYGLQEGQEMTASAMEYAWEHWDRIRGMENPRGYLYRVGCHSRSRRRLDVLDLPPVDGRLPWIEPGLPRALSRLSRKQRTSIVLLHCFQWTHAEVAELLGVARGTVEKHEQRAFDRLRRDLGVST